jgi:hypothetical protein
MDLNYTVTSSTDEANALYMMAISIATATYPSVDAENAAILAGMPAFKAALDVLAEEAFCLGQETTPMPMHSTHTDTDMSTSGMAGATGMARP